MNKLIIFVALHTTNVEAHIVLQWKQFCYMYIAISYSTYLDYPVFSTKIVTLLSSDFNYEDMNIESIAISA